MLNQKIIWAVSLDSYFLIAYVDQRLTNAVD